MPGGARVRPWESVARFDLDDERVAVCGDWHGNASWLRTVVSAIPVLAPDVRTILQLGDWWMDAERTDALFQRTGIERVLVTTGNHEPWNRLTPLMEAHPGRAIRVSAATWILARPFRMSIGGREVLSLGGASSVDRAWRREGVDWWPDEAITEGHVEAAVAGGSADLLLTHESPEGTPVRAVNRILHEDPPSWPAAALAASTESRRRVTRVWDAVRPPLLAHGHMHVAGGGKTADGRRVASLNRDGGEGHLAFLDLASLTMTVPSLREIHAAAQGASSLGYE
ncbi:metallophosphoesterase [Microbacterium sp. zg.Y1084]|nr:metallophosphoesterase [Microbacterium sp. zg.Y1084]MCR2813035.1 metallophosphoesterase [Microbacterium sp. zg.Y1084]